MFFLLHIILSTREGSGLGWGKPAHISAAADFAAWTAEKSWARPVNQVDLTPRKEQTQAMSKGSLF